MKTKESELNILIAAAGTGGHIFPALAVAEQLETTYHINWLGVAHGMEHNLVHYPIFDISAVGVRGKKWSKLLLAPFKIFWSIAQTIFIIKKNNIRCVLGFGGFIGGIAGIAAFLTRTPLIIHEQNSIAGTSNKYLRPLAKHCFSAFDNVLTGAITCGNPIRWQAYPKENITQPHTQPNILVIGGSLGAQALNEIIPQLTIDANIYHQCGEKHLNSVTELYKKHHHTAEISAFIKDMAHYYAWADIVICRAGAMTISELIKTKSVAILVPFPHAIDNHQYHNARILEKANCALLIEQKDLTLDKLTSAINSLDSARIKQMQDNFQVFPTQDGAKLIKECVDNLVL